MRDETLAGLIEAAGNIGTTLAKEFVTARQEQKVLERRREHELELASARSQADDTSASGGDTSGSSPRRAQQQPSEPDSVGDALSEAEDLATAYDEMLDDAAAMEECDLCTELIRRARDRPVSEQSTLIPQLRDFLTETDGSESVSELSRRLQNRPELLELLQESL